MTYQELREKIKTELMVLASESARKGYEAGKNDTEYETLEDQNNAYMDIMFAVNSYEEK